MTKKALLLPFIAMLVTGSASLSADSKSLEPQVTRMGIDGTSVRFVNPSSPRLTKWGDGLIVMNCPVGHKFVVTVGTGSDHSGLYNEKATCQPIKS